jgi:hypothetical protein
MQTTILGMAPSTSTQRGKRTRKGKQPIQDDQPQPEAVFRPSWVRSMPTNCNRVIIETSNFHFVKNCCYIFIFMCMTYPFVFLNADFCPSMAQWPFCYDGCRLSTKSFLFF